MINVQDTLNTLGITHNYRGYRRVVSALVLVFQDEDRFDAIIRDVYQKVAQEYNCDWSAVERALRTIVRRAWKTNQEFLIKIAGYPLTEPPPVSEFIAILYNYIKRSNSN